MKKLPIGGGRLTAIGCYLPYTDSGIHCTTPAIRRVGVNKTDGQPLNHHEQIDESAM